MADVIIYMLTPYKKHVHTITADNGKPQWPVAAIRAKGDRFESGDKRGAVSLRETAEFPAQKVSGI